MRSPEKRLREIWEGGRIERSHASAALRLLSLPYAAAVSARNGLYDRGLIRPEKLPCPVVSVGNLTVGGTGKTPVVVWIARMLRDRGCRPAVLSRGYGGRAKAAVNIVSDGDRLHMGWREAGDEPVMMAGALHGVPVLTGPKRLLTGRFAATHFGADVLILDDGFQHRSVARDIDIVLVDAVRPFGNGFLLPRGPLREAPRALRRAGILLRTGDAGRCEPLPEEGLVPSFRGVHRPLELVEASTGARTPAETLQGQRVFAFAGIGCPEGFRRSLAALGAEVSSFHAFPDHHPYDRSDMERIHGFARRCKAFRIVTTEKDGVRLADLPDLRTGISILRIEMEITPSEPFAELIFSRVANKQ